jgi:sugar phosphate isomerase/epimerase
MIGLSTAYFTERDGITGQDIVGEILELGFSALELEYRVRETTYREMRPLILGENLRVVSVHNFFPLPDDEPVSKASGDRFLLSSLDREERELAIRMTIRTIECAGNLGATAVVLHLGKVDMEPENERLEDLFYQQKLDTPEGRDFLKAKLRERSERRTPYVENVLFSLDQLNREAEKRGIILGVENRYHYHQIPDFEEIGLILNHFSGSSIRYWHDIGHAHTLEKLRIVEPGSHLRSYGLLSAGIHIHDSIGTDDHWAPGRGEVDFAEAADWLRSAPIKILEVHEKSNRTELVKARDMLKRVGIV